MKKFNLKQYFSTFGARIRSLLIISLFLFFTTFFLFCEMSKLNYLMYPPALAIGLLCLIYFIKKKQMPNFRPLICVYTFVALAYLITFIVNPMQALTYKTLFVLAAFATAIYLSCSIINNQKIILYSILIAGIIFCIAYLVIYFKQIIKLNFSDRLGGFFGNENDVALRFSFIAAVLATVVITNKKYWLLIFVLPIYLFILSTGSKKGFGCVLLISIYAIFLIFKKKPFVALIISVSFITIALIMLFTIPALATMKERTLSFISNEKGESADGSTYTRDLFKNNAYYISFKNLFFGYGINGFAKVTGFGTYSHDNISEVLIDFSIFGLILFYGIVLNCFKGIRFKKYIKDGSIVYFLMIAIYIVLSTSFIYYESKTFYVLISICLYLSYKNKLPLKHASIRI